MGARTCHYGGACFLDCRDEVVIAAVCDNRAERLAEGREIYGEAFGYDISGFDDYRRMYEEAGLDAVYVAGPNHLHRDLSVAAFDAGLHVLCEKPMDTTLAKCDEMIAAARRAGKALGLGMQMRFRKRYHKVRELIEQGRLGTVAMVWCTEYRCQFAATKDWVWQKAKSGGAIVEKNCHHYDILNLWVDSRPTTVYATGSIIKHATGAGGPSDIIDNAWIVNDYECGARAMVGICFLGRPGAHYREFGVQGTEGKVFFSHHDAEKLHVEYNTGEVETYDLSGVPDIRGGVFRDFVACVKSGDAPFVTGELGRASLLVPLAAEKSIAEKRVVHVDEAA